VPEASSVQRLVLVEDEALIRLDISECLRDIGYEVEEAASATQALSLLQAKDGDVAGVVIDLGLPDRRGDDLAADLRAANPSLPIIIASGYSSKEVRGRFADDAFIAFVDKPFNAAQIERALKEMTA